MKVLRVLSVGLLVTAGALLGLETSASAGCNFHGCSQVPGVECNFHGCPNPPNGGECNFHGCPPATQRPNNPPQTQPGATYVPVPVYPVYPPYPYPYPQPVNQRSQANPEEIAKCMKSLMWAQRDQYEGLDRTEISEQAAMQACTGGR